MDVLYTGTDRVYANDLRAAWDAFREGVLADGLEVTPGAMGLSVDVAPGVGYVRGDEDDAQGLYRVRESDPVNSDAFPLGGIEPADATHPRIDQIVVRVYDAEWDDSGSEEALLEVLTGDPTAGADLTDLDGAANLPDTALRLAWVLVAADATEITADDVLDARESAIAIGDDGGSSLPAAIEAALLAASDPGGANPFATIDDLDGLGGGASLIVGATPTEVADVSRITLQDDVFTLADAGGGEAIVYLTGGEVLTAEDTTEAISGANAPDGANPFATMADVGGGASPWTDEGAVLVATENARVELPGGGTAFGARYDTDAEDRWRVAANGLMEWGAGAAAQDTNLYRAAANRVASDGDLQARSGLAGQARIGAVGPASQAGVLLGDTGDVNLYRSAANTLKTDDALDVGGMLRVPVDTWHSDLAGGQRLYFSNGSSTLVKSPTSSVILRAGDDTNAYTFGTTASVFNRPLTIQRAAGFAFSTQITGDSFARGFFDVNGTINWGPGTATQDVNLYRAAADQLKTDDRFDAALDVYARSGAAGQARIGAVGPSSEAGILFGSAGDVGIYRSDASNLTLTSGDSLAALKFFASGDMSTAGLAGAGLIVKSPDGLVTRRIRIDNTGAIVSVAV